MSAEPSRGSGPSGESTRQVAARFEIVRRGFLDADGEPLGELPAFAGDRDQVVALYRAMVLTRTFDERAVALQRTGQLGTFASSVGQEAVTVGIGASMAADDVLIPTYRELGAQLWRGVTMVELFRYWSGDERGSDYAGPRRDFPPCVPIATQAPHAVGVAMAMKIRGEPRVAVCAIGDGGTSKGDFMEAVNAAGVWKLPLVFVVDNNRWAISVPLAGQTAAETLAQKAIAGGIGGEQVDGNDVVAVRHAVGEAVERARTGGGPSLVEALTYRMGDHTTADDASRYRSDAEVAEWRGRDPVARVRRYMERRSWWTAADETALTADCLAMVDEARAAYLATEKQPATEMFDHLYAAMPPAIARQRAETEDAGDG